MEANEQHIQVQMSQKEEKLPMSQMDQQALRRELDQNYKPIFEPYEEEGGMPMHILQDQLQQQGATRVIAQGKIDLILKKADTDKDGRLDYEEFVKIVTAGESQHLSTRQLSAFQYFVRGAVSTVVPRPQQQVRSHDQLDGDDYEDEDYLSQFNCSPPPLFIILISLAEVAVFIYYAVDLADTTSPVTANTGVPLYSPLIYNPKRRYEAWRYLTYMFIHQGYLHLIFNLIFQLVIGIPLELVHKWWRVGIVYLLGCIAGSMCHSVVDMNTMLAGASGGCYALIGAHLAIIIMNWKEMTHDWMEGPIRFILSAPVRLTVWILMAGIDTGVAIYNRYSGVDTNVGYAAHFGGVVAGVLVGIPVLKNINKLPWEEKLWVISLVAYLLLVVFAVFWNIFYPGFPETDWRACCPNDFQ